MNHADRQRLSHILSDIADMMPEAPLNADAIGIAVAEARAIVDAPTSPDLIINIRNAKLDQKSVERLKAMIAEGGPNFGRFSIGGINPGTETIRPDTHPEFFAQPVQEYQPIEAYGLRTNRGTHRAPKRHIRTVLGLTIAATTLTALTASNAPHSGTDRPTPQTRPAKPPSEAAQAWFRPGQAPYIPGHAPGTPGNGLGVVVAP